MLGWGVDFRYGGSGGGGGGSSMDGWMGGRINVDQCRAIGRLLINL